MYKPRSCINRWGKNEKKYKPRLNLTLVQYVNQTQKFAWNKGVAPYSTVIVNKHAFDVTLYGCCMYFFLQCFSTKATGWT